MSETRITISFTTGYWRDIARAASAPNNHPTEDQDECGSKWFYELMPGDPVIDDDPDGDRRISCSFSSMADLWEFLRRVMNSGLKASQMQPALYVTMSDTCAVARFSMDSYFDGQAEGQITIRDSERSKEKGDIIKRIVADVSRLEEIA